jgi:D-alanyl-lipoteichoic acid acyltransferase DltB (MBOAT superfamily)
MMPQFNQDRRYRLRLDDLAVGLSWFLMGLAKKVLLADSFSGTANQVFAMHGAVPFSYAWRGVLSYALQLYFDFSGYSDMALGLARMFSINFPLNFSSPYKSANIIEFWQRWHMTLTAYINAYLYSPIQFSISRRRQAQGKKVSRKAQATPEGFLHMIAIPTIVTMFVVGVWHGAGFQYIAFGLIHGAYLTINHAWRLLGPKPDPTRILSPFQKNLRHAGGVLLTFFAVVFAQVFFRADSTHQALSIVSSLAGLHGLALHRLLPNETASSRAIEFAGMAAGFFIVWALPNTQQLLARFHPSLQISPWDEAHPAPARALWTPNLGWALTLGCLFFIVLVRLQDPSTFLYFQF